MLLKIFKSKETHTEHFIYHLICRTYACTLHYIYCFCCYTCLYLMIYLTFAFTVAAEKAEKAQKEAQKAILTQVKIQLNNLGK